MLIFGAFLAKLFMDMSGMKMKFGMDEMKFTSPMVMMNMNGLFTMDPMNWGNVDLMVNMDMGDPSSKVTMEFKNSDKSKPGEESYIVHYDSDFKLTSLNKDSDVHATMVYMEEYNWVS